MQAGLVFCKHTFRIECKQDRSHRLAHCERGFAVGRRGAEPVLAADGRGDGAGGGADDGRHVPALVRRREAGLAEVLRRRRGAEPVRPLGKTLRRGRIKAGAVLRSDF